MRLQLAVMSGKLTRFLCKTLKLGEGSNLPGKLARLLDPQILFKLAQGRDTLLVTGTNGKTTTTHLVAKVLQENHRTYVHNSYGANLETGIITSLLSKSSLWGSITCDYNLFEVDEATLPLILKSSHPLIIVLTNIFRDQLDRYGDLDHLLKGFRKALSTLPSTTILVVNGDDPLLFSLTSQLCLPIIYYGLEGVGEVGTQYQVADMINCPKCKTPYRYRVRYYAHLGLYQCPSCGEKRPTPKIYGTQIELFPKESIFKLHHQEGTIKVKLQLPGTYNIYNFLAAFTLCQLLGFSPATIKETLEGFQPVFGRMEEFFHEGREVKIILVKNPTGFNEVLRIVSADPRQKGILFLLNDNKADGEDISWIWDVNFSPIKGEKAFYVSGLRAEDMALRLKYSGLKGHLFPYQKDLKEKLQEIPGEVIYILPTYTALLYVKKIFKESKREGKYDAP